MGSEGVRPVRWRGVAGDVRVHGVVTFFAALLPRLGFVLHGGGLGGTFGYDSSVYYAASVALLHGRLPYQDFVLLHPPGIALALTPFAAIGNLTSDHTGFVVATLAVMVVGSVNAVLVGCVARRMGIAPYAALAGGLFYAVWVGAVGAEYLVRLEPLGNLLVLLGLLAYFAGIRTGNARYAVASGLAIGAAAAVKIWFIVPALIVVLWHLRGGNLRRRLLACGLGCVASLFAIDGPFFVAAPRRMWSMTVADQLGRQNDHPLSHRLNFLSTAGVYDKSLSDASATPWVVVIGLVVLVIAVLAWRAPGGQVAATLLLAHVGVLVTAPSYFTFYNDFLAVPLALTVAAGVHTACGFVRRPVRRGVRWTVAAAAAVALGVAGAAAVYLPQQTVFPFPSAALAPAVAESRCVMSDSPIALIQLNVLSRDLDRGCRNWIDVTGRTYGVDAMYRNGKSVARARNPKWQRDLRRYLFSGDAAILYRPVPTGVGPRLSRLLQRSPVLARANGLTVYRTRRS